MTAKFTRNDASLLTRRDVVVGALKTAFVASALTAPAERAGAAAANAPWRAINIMNFIRAEEPREPMDLMEPVRGQMALIKAHGFPATWLLQYDALVEGPFVAFLKAEMPPTHEVGVWFEMNRRICDDAGVAWRGNRGLGVGLSRPGRLRHRLHAGGAPPARGHGRGDLPARLRP